MKKIFSLTITMIMFIYVLTVCASALTYGDLTYIVSNGEVTITDCSTYATSVTIPSAIDGYPVTSIGEDAFYKCTGLTSVTIGESVTSIGEDAFYNCTGLTQINWNAKNVADFSSGNDVFSKAGQSGEGINVVFGDNVERIPAYVFYPYSNLSYAPKIVSVTIGDSVTSIGDRAFYNCTGLTSVTIGESVTSIGENAFYNCTGLTQINWNAKNVADFSSGNDVFSKAGQNGEGIKVVFGDSVERIPAYAFYPYSQSSYAPKIVSVTIGDNVTSIGSYAFYNCTGLTSVTIPDSVTSIGDDAFYKCTGITQINWNAKSVADFSSDNYVFYCAGQSGEGINVIFGDNVERIPAYVFCPYSNSSYAPKIVSVTIGDSVTRIGSSAFSNCTGLTSVTIPDSVTSIGSSAFSNCTGLTSVTIPDSVTSIGSSAFYYCTGLTSVTIPDSITSIGDSAFSNCTGLTSVTIGESVTSIGNWAFSYCTGLTSVTIGESVTRIGSYAFYNCTGLTQINWNAKNVADFSSGNDVFSKAGQSGEGINVVFGDNVERIPAYVFYPYSNSSYAPKIVSVTIGESVTRIGSYAFYNCTGITSITIPDSVTSIGSSAFYYCTGLTSVTIPDSITSIGDSAFYYCTGLTSVTIGESVTSIGNWAFSYCTGLTSITIPDSVTSIGNYAFYNCTGLTQINWNAKNVADFSYDNFVFAYAGQSGEGINVVFGDNVERIPAYVFSPYSGAPKIVSVTIGESVTSIDEDAFSNCTGLTSITIPDSVTSIGSSAFYNTAYYNNSNNWTNGVLYIGNHLIEADESISGTYTIKNGTKCISDDAFYNCVELISIDVPDSVLSIGNSAFGNCNKLRRISMESGVQTVGTDAFDGCTSLTKVNTPTINDWCEISFADRESNPLYYTKELYINNVLLESDIIFPEGITSIGTYAFYDLPYLGDCILPSSLKKVGDNAFGNTIAKIDNVYFQGSEDDWYAISIGTGNDALIDNPLYTDYYPTDPQIKYAINSVKVKDVVGNSLNNIPNTAFIAEIKVTNVASYTNNYILIATYDTDGRMLDIDFLYANPKVGQTVTFGTQIKNENGNVAKIKAFVISDLKSFSAVAEAVELVKV